MISSAPYNMKVNLSQEFVTKDLIKLNQFRALSQRI